MKVDCKKMYNITHVQYTAALRSGRASRWRPQAAVHPYYNTRQFGVGAIGEARGNTACGHLGPVESFPSTEANSLSVLWPGEVSQDAEEGVEGCGLGVEVIGIRQRCGGNCLCFPGQLLAFRPALMIQWVDGQEELLSWRNTAVGLRQLCRYACKMLLKTWDLTSEDRGSDEN